MDEDPDIAVLRIRHRPSQGGGRILAAPEATAQQLGVSRRAARRPKAADESAFTDVAISLRGGLGAEPLDAVRRLMAVVATKAGVAFRENDASPTPEAGSWTWDARFNPEAPPGRVRVRLADARQVQTMAEEVQGRAVQVGADLVAIEITNYFYAPGARRPKTRGEPGAAGPWRSPRP